MTHRQGTSRRALLKATASTVGLSLAGSAVTRGQAPESRPSGKAALRFPNEQFYDGNGRFLVEKAKDAIVALCHYHGYPIFSGLREKLWVSDYGKGRFTQLGLAAYAFVNNEEDRYMLMDLFLLPHQMLPEHWHLEGGKNPAKREGWLVRWGLSHIVGIGEPNLSKEVVIPACHLGGQVTTRHATIATPGVFVKLAKVGTPHWQYAGPEGAIVTEVANVHTDAAVRHSDPEVNRYFLGG